MGVWGEGRGGERRGGEGRGEGMQKTILYHSRVYCLCFCHVSLYARVPVWTIHVALVCPDVRGLIGACVIDCTEGSCADGQLCCSNGCGRTCMDGVPRPVNCSDVSSLGCRLKES